MHCCRSCRPSNFWTLEYCAQHSRTMCRNNSIHISRAFHLIWCTKFPCLREKTPILMYCAVYCFCLNWAYVFVFSAVLMIEMKKLPNYSNRVFFFCSTFGNNENRSIFTIENSSILADGMSKIFTRPCVSNVFINSLQDIFLGFHAIWIVASTSRSTYLSQILAAIFVLFLKFFIDFPTFA